MDKRLKIIRKQLNLTQEEFANILGVKRTSYASYETGRVIPASPFIKLICNKYSINEEWLVSGTGEIFINSNGDLLELLKSKYKLSNFEFKILKTYLELDVNQRKAVENFAHKIFSSEPDSVTAKDNSHLEIVSDDKAIGKEVGSIDTLLNGSYIINLNIIPKKEWYW